MSPSIRSGLFHLDSLVPSQSVTALTQHATLIGGAPYCDIELQGEGISSEHALIEQLDGGQFWIRDCGSEEGTYVNDERITAQHLLPGDRIRLGSQLFKFLSGERFESQFQQAVYEMVTVDGLTGAQQRRHFEDAFSREVLRAQRHWRPIALLAFDIDDFRSISQRLGCSAGDECLRAFSRRVCSRIRGEDLFARFGGSQFFLALSEAPLKQSVRIAQDLRRLVEAEPFDTSCGPVCLTISIGLGFASGQGPVSAREIMQLARENLKKAKASGRNCVIY